MQFKSSALPAPKRDRQGNVMYERFSEPGRAPRALLDFEILPDQMSRTHISYSLTLILSRLGARSIGSS